MESKIEKAKRQCLADGTLECEYGYWYRKPNTERVGYNEPIEWVWREGKKPDYIKNGIIGGANERVWEKLPVSNVESTCYWFRPVTNDETTGIFSPINDRYS